VEVSLLRRGDEPKPPVDWLIEEVHASARKRQGPDR
jgi:hypothetical protein